MKNAKIDYFEASNFLLSVYFSKYPHEDKTEIAASITHWLQNPKSKPIKLPEEFKSEFNKLLSTYSGLADAKLSIDHFIKNKIPKVKPSISYESIKFPPPENPRFTFIDLFAGIGGFRIALQNLGGKCVFSCEWDNSCKKTYFNNFGEVPFGDIKQFTKPDFSSEKIRELIPKHTILAAGFPCQPFSRAGISARNSLGQVSGFNCEIQGTLFFDIVRIAKALEPEVLFLENVKNLKRHDGGRTYKLIEKTIRDLKYDFNDEVIDSSTVVPQKRERCYMVCFKRGNDTFKFPDFSGKQLPLKSILEDNVSRKFTISDKLWKGHIERTDRNIKRGTGFTAFEADIEKPSNTIVARYWKDGKECLIPQENKNPRMLRPEGSHLQSPQNRT
jgi:DNA (cytosine-5)-methyltransferase 1